MRRFLIVIEKANSNYSAYSPDLPGCVATGKTMKKTEENMAEAIRMHIKGIIQDYQPVPKSRSIAEYILVQ